jgi:tetratricopeptide (TPR) repeat protein
MRNISHIKALIIVLVTLFTTGCAHKQLIDEGEDFNRQGRYELAVDTYKKALELKPNNRKTQQLLSFAQGQLDNWLDDLLIQADLAKKQGLKGRALVLYSKVAQLRRDSYAINQYKQLHSQLSKTSRYQIAIKYPNTLGSNLGQQLNDIQVISRADTKQSNQFNMKVTFAKPKFTTRKVNREASEQYISGIETITNPEFLHLRDDIGELRIHVHELNIEFDHLSAQIDHHLSQLSSLRKDREIAQLRLGNATPNSQNQSHWRQEVARLNKAINNAEQRLHAQRRELDGVDHSLSDSQRHLDEQLNTLSYLPPTIQQDVYSDYFYQVLDVTRTGAGKLTVTFNNKSHKSSTVTAKYTDETHEAHPQINLRYNPSKLISDSKLTAKYYQNVRTQAEKAIVIHAQQYRDNLRNAANQVADVDHQLENWVKYGLASSQGVDHNTARQMTNQLQLELGHVGEFPVNQLLHLFR